MITAAIAAMKEKEGSSRQAIAKYIENEYKNLSPAHPTLLTQQLKRMKNNGQLVMVKHSYMLPRSVPFPFSTTGGNGNNIAAASSGSTNSVFANPQASDSPKRRPGRPPKARPEIQPNGVGGPENGFVSAGPQNIGPQFGYSGGPPSTGPQFSFPGLQTIDPGQFGGPLTGFSAFGQVGGPGTGPVNTFSQFGQLGGPLNTVPTFGQQVGGLTNTGPIFDPIGAVPTVVPIGQVDGLPPGKRRGRPPKEVKSAVVGAEPVGPLVVSVGPVDGVQSTVTKRGRPPKLNNEPRPIGKRGRGRPKVLPVINGGVQKRGRGRPPIGGQRPRGRPKKGAVSTVGLTGKPRGRPRKNVALNGLGALSPVDGAGGGGGGVLPVKRAGRPPKMGVAKKTRKLSGKPLGRPKKVILFLKFKLIDVGKLIPLIFIFMNLFLCVYIRL